MSKPLKFHLVHRDDHDPLALDENSSGYVLQLVDTAQGRRRTRAEGSAVSSIKLPESSLASQFEEKSGILARNELITGAIYNAPEDVQAALFRHSDEEFDELEDDFMAQAMASGSDCNTDYDSSIGDISEYDGEELIRIDSEDDDEDMSDDHVVRPGMLGDMDNHFENLMLQYNSDEIGELDDGVEGVLSDVEDEMLDEFITTSEKKYEPCLTVSNSNDDIVEMTRAQINRQLKDEEGYDTDRDNQALEDECRPKEVEQWDCESILSTLNNVENHPRLIREPRSKPVIKSNIMSCPVPEHERLQDGIKPGEKQQCNLGLRRPKNETSEERLARKKAIREARQERRSGKKQLKLEFSAKKTAKCRNEFFQKTHNSSSIKL